MVFGFAVVWVHPYQGCISTLDEVAKKLTLLTTSGENWAYTFVWFNEDAQHVPLPKQGHLSTMIERVPSRITCGHLCQLEVHLLLQSRVPSGLPGRAEWGPGACSDISTRITHPQGEYAQGTYIPTSGPFSVHNRWLCTWGLNSLQNFDSNFPYTSSHGTSP